MANKEQQIKNSFIYLSPIIISNLLPFITLPIFTRILTREDYGVLALAQVYAIFVSGLANFGMTTAYNRNYFQYRVDRLKTAQLLYSTLGFVVFNFICKWDYAKQTLEEQTEETQIAIAKLLGWKDE